MVAFSDHEKINGGLVAFLLNFMEISRSELENTFKNQHSFHLNASKADLQLNYKIIIMCAIIREVH